MKDGLFFLGSGREQEELLANRELFFSTNGDLKCLRGRACRSIFVSYCVWADRYTDYTVRTMCQTLSYCKMKPCTKGKLSYLERYFWFIYPIHIFFFLFVEVLWSQRCTTDPLLGVIQSGAVNHPVTGWAGLMTVSTARQIRCQPIER